METNSFSFILKEIFFKASTCIWPDLYSLEIFSILIISIFHLSLHISPYIRRIDLRKCSIKLNIFVNDSGDISHEPNLGTFLRPAKNICLEKVCPHTSYKKERPGRSINRFINYLITSINKESIHTLFSPSYSK